MDDIREAGMDGILQVDALAQEEFYLAYARKSPMEPEKRLMLAVLSDAIEGFRRYVQSRNKKDEETLKWILEKNTNWFFSFEGICEVLGFDVDYLRSGLLKWGQVARAPLYTKRGARKKGAHA